MNPPELPSISIILTGHNEEYCIGDAIRSVFGQDYEGPVEIILSDDGSSDGTFAVMQEMAAEYRGPHRVVLNRNETPLGAGRIYGRWWSWPPMNGFSARMGMIVPSPGGAGCLPGRWQGIRMPWLSLAR